MSIYKCGECGAVSETRKESFAHWATHHNLDETLMPYAVKCPNCEKAWENEKIVVENNKVLFGKTLELEAEVKRLNGVIATLAAYIREGSHKLSNLGLAEPDAEISQAASKANANTKSAVAVLVGSERTDD